MNHIHHYKIDVVWTGNRGTGTKAYQGYGRDHEIHSAGKPVLAGSSDPMFHGDAGKYNPEDMLVAALSTCHMLWYLHQAALTGVVVTAYADAAEGTMETNVHGGRFTEVVLHPVVTIAAGSDPVQAGMAHEPAHRACFIANSVNFPVRVEPRIVVESV